MTEVKQRITYMESSLEKLNQQEEKYTAELDEALAQYAELQQQAADIGAMELDTARQAIRHDKEHEVMQQLQNTYGKLFVPAILAQSRKDVANLLDEASEPVSLRQKIQQACKQQDKHYHAKNYNQER